MGRRQRRRERTAARTLDVDPDGEPARLGERGHEVLSRMGLERPGRVVQQDSHGAELGQHLRALDQRIDFAGGAWAVDEARFEVSVRGDDRFGRLAQVRHVVQWIV